MSVNVRLTFAVILAATFGGVIAISASAQNLIPRTTERPSFDCDKARAPIEVLICADADLAKWDARLGHAYNNRARQLGTSERKALLQERRQWAVFRRTEFQIPSTLSDVNEAANSKSCFLKVTQERIEVLGAGLVNAMQGNDPPDAASVIKTAATVAVAQAEPEPRNLQGGTGYEVALHTLANKLVSQLQSAGQKSATVLDFTDLQSQGTELGRFLAQELSDQLVAGAKTISLVDRANLQFLLKENKLSMDGLVDPQSSRKLGNMIGIDTVIMGTVTPLGNSVRLSVRAVAVETGKIVAAQSITVAAVGGLGEMYTRGVASNASPSEPGITAVASKSTVRDRLRADSFTLIPGELVANSNAFNGSQISFSIENRSGIGVGIAIRGGATSAGPCRSQDMVSGLAVISDSGIQQVTQSPDPVKLMRWFPANARASVSIQLDPYQCPAMLQGVRSVPLTVNLVVASGKDVLVLPLNADKVPVRLIQ